MKGYKATDLNMRCRGMQYEVGGVYHVDGEIEPCKNGLHFCEHMKDVFNYYGRDNSRVFEVEASGVIKNYGDKFVTSDLKIIGELSKVEMNRCVYSYGNGDGYGYGYGYSDGYGFGDGDGYGYYGFGNGDGYGFSNGEGCGDGYSNSNGNGKGDGDGDGCGNDGCGNDYYYGYGIHMILVFV